MFGYTSSQNDQSCAVGSHWYVVYSWYIWNQTYYVRPTNVTKTNQNTNEDALRFFTFYHMSKIKPGFSYEKRCNMSPIAPSVSAGLNMGMLFWHRHHIHTQYSHLMVYSQKKKNTLTERRVKYTKITIYILKWSLHLFHSSTGNHSPASSQYVYLSQVTRLMCTRTHLVGPVAKRFRVVDLLA